MLRPRGDAALVRRFGPGGDPSVFLLRFVFLPASSPKIVPASSPFSSSPSSPSSSNPSPALAMTTTASANHHGATFPGPPAGRAQSPTISASSVGGQSGDDVRGRGSDLVHLERRPGSSGSRGPPPPAARRATFASEGGSRPGFAARASSFVGASSSSSSSSSSRQSTAATIARRSTAI